MSPLMPKSSGYLFVSCVLRELLEDRADALRHEVEQLEPNRLLNTAPHDLVQYLVGKYTTEVPSLRKDDWTVDEREIQIDVRNDPNRYISDRSRPFYVPGQHIEIEIPFDGEPELFYARASTSTSSAPRAIVQGESIVMAFDIPQNAQRDVRAEIDRTVGEIEQHLSWVRADVDAFNRTLQSRAQTSVTERRERILSNQGRVAALGIPLKPRPGTANTCTVPTVRRKVIPTLPPASSVPYKPEYRLESEHYDHILNVIQNMAQVMERSPSAFASMGEEDLRQHFLVQLNGHFEGNATGETFNVGGKTDILLRANGRNVFIAECKFWKGPKQYVATIDQLLGYTAWRDSKTAILIFNRGTDMTTVLSTINAQTPLHPQYKRPVDWKHETGFRYVFHQKHDVNRELILTVLVFDVPSAT